MIEQHRTFDGFKVAMVAHGDGVDWVNDWEW